jgi:hypothetical protein
MLAVLALPSNDIGLAWKTQIGLKQPRRSDTTKRSGSCFPFYSRGRHDQYHEEADVKRCCQAGTYKAVSADFTGRVEKQPEAEGVMDHTMDGPFFVN